MTMSVEGYSWLVVRACGANSTQLLQLLAPYQGRFPNTDAEYNALAMSLRRMGHILEGTPGNISNQLRQSPNQGFFANGSQAATAFMTNAETAGQLAADPWNQGADPWSQVHASAPAASSWQGAPPAPPAPPASAAFMTAVGDDDTDSETVSTTGEFDHSDPALYGLDPAAIDEHLFFQYQKAKANWRKHMHKPTRRVRKFVKRSGKGKGGGKGWSRCSFLAEMPDGEYDELFYGGKGTSKGTPRSFAKGKGRRTNPKRRDGLAMKCSMRLPNGSACGSEQHFRAQC